MISVWRTCEGCTAYWLYAQVLRSLVFLHGLDLIHADLKPENILIKSYSR